MHAVPYFQSQDMQDIVKLKSVSFLVVHEILFLKPTQSQIHV